MRRVAVTGVSLLDPKGGSTIDFFDRILNGESSISLYQTQDRPKPISSPALHCDGFSAEKHIGKTLAGSMDRYSQLGMAAVLDAWSVAGLPTIQDHQNDRWGVSWGTALGGTHAYEHGLKDLWQKGKERLPPMSVVLGMNNACASHIAIKLGLGASCLTYSIACASAATAIGEGFNKIRKNEADLMVVGGSDNPLIYGVFRAWEAMRVLATGNSDTAPAACRPFDISRSGLVLGEGAAALILEDWDHATARGAEIICEIAGYGVNCDHKNLVRPDMSGQVKAITMALSESGLSSTDVGYINAHGTATLEGDPIEISAIREVFGTHAENLPVSATKSSHGHLMGASGAIEAAITVLALSHDKLPPTANLVDIDPKCEGVKHIIGSSLTGTRPRAAISNCFAFGGSNAVLAFKSVQRKD
jgi:3-oxoacyl-[acyl-carrier-protein] synthase II